MGANDQVGVGQRIVSTEMIPPAMAAPPPPPPRPRDPNATTVEMPRIYEDANHIRAELQRVADEVVGDNIADVLADLPLPALSVRICPEHGPSVNVEWRDMPQPADVIVLTEALLKRLPAPG